VDESDKIASMGQRGSIACPFMSGLIQASLSLYL
jgi:hypothetical protein